MQARIYRSAYVTIALIICNILVYAYMLFAGTDVYETYGLDSFNILEGREYYSMITSMFMHASVEHIFNNIFPASISLLYANAIFGYNWNF